MLLERAQVVVDLLAGQRRAASATVVADPGSASAARIRARIGSSAATRGGGVVDDVEVEHDPIVSMDKQICQ